jgi:RNA polymerase sigma-70 factor (ECF subfamily)
VTGSETTRLVDAARAGDRMALEDLYARHQGRLLHVIRARMPAALARRVAPEDVLQETLLESSRKIDAFEPQGPSSFYRWLVAIARFKVSEAARAQKADKRAHERPLDAPVFSEQTSASGAAMRGERRAELDEAIAALPERQAEAVRLRYLEGSSLAETAQALECTESAVKALVSRGLMALATRGTPRA